MRHPLFLSSLLIPLLAMPFGCKTRSGGNDLKEAWFMFTDSKDRPVQVVADQNEYIRKYEALPVKGELTARLWTYASKTGRHAELNHAVAALLFAEPRDLKANRTHPAYPAGAIKAMLVKFVADRSRADDGVETRSLGGICRLDSDAFRQALESRAISLESIKNEGDNQCFSVNAGAFHLALANLIGLRQQGFLIDPEIDTEFAHHALSAFASETLGIAVQTPENHTRLPIKTTVSYLLPTGELKSKIYRYTLEMDERGDIVNGEWLGEAIPQLIWMQNRPRFQSEDKRLEDLYTRSVSLPARMATQAFSALEKEEPRVLVLDREPLLVNHRYRIELSGDVPRGADGLKVFLESAFEALGPISIYRNTFADEDRVVSVEVQLHSAQSIEQLKQAVRGHSNDRAEIERILR